MVEVKESGFGRVDLVFDNYRDANKCLKDKGEGGGMGKYMNFSIPNRSKSAKGIVAGWNKHGTLDELVAAMCDTGGILEIEHVKKKIFDKETKAMRDEYSSVVCITWEGNFVPNELLVYGGITSLRVRPFIDNVLQCYSCYRFGHLARYYRRQPVCVACGEQFHGHCTRDWTCVNCGGKHKPTDRKCKAYRYNQEIKRVMAEASVSVYEAKERLASKKIYEREEWRRVKDRPRFSSVGRISGRIRGRGLGQENFSEGGKDLNLIDLGDSEESCDGRSSYAEVARGTYNVRNRDFPILKSQGKIVGDRSKDKHVEIEQDSVDAELSVQKDMRNVWSMVERREQLIGEIVNKLRNELRVDILRILREEVRQKLRMVIGDAIREEVRAVLTGDGSAFFRETARESVEENIRERVVGTLNEEIIESESKINELFKKTTE